MDETQLPPKEAFYSKLSDTDISDEENQHALNVFESFKCGIMRIYHNLYMMSMMTLLFLLFFSVYNFVMYFAIFRISHCYFCNDSVLV